MFNTKTLDTEAEQVRITWSKYRGGRGTYIGVTGRTCVSVLGQHSCPGQIYAGNSRDNKVLKIFVNTNTLYIQVKGWVKRE